MQRWVLRLAQDPVDRRALERNLDPFTGRVQMRQSSIEAPHGRIVRGSHLHQITDIHELREVIHDGRGAQVRPC